MSTCTALPRALDAVHVAHDAQVHLHSAAVVDADRSAVLRVVRCLNHSGAAHSGGAQRYVHLDVGAQVDPYEIRTLKGMYFQLIDNQVLSTQGQPDVNLHHLTWSRKPPTM